MRVASKLYKCFIDTGIDIVSEEESLTYLCEIC